MRTIDRPSENEDSTEIEAFEAEFLHTCDEIEPSNVVIPGILKATGRSIEHESKNDPTLLEKFQEEWLTNTRTFEKPHRPFRRSSTEDTLNRYLHNIGQFPLLTSSGEVYLAKLVQLGLSEDPSDEESEVYDWAKNKFHCSNLRLVVSIAKKLVKNSVNLLDLIQEGNFGLDVAILKFDHRKGFRFSTYATPWIEQAIRVAIGESAFAAKLPRDAPSDIRTLDGHSFKYEADEGREISDEKLAQLSGKTLARIKALKPFRISPLSFDRKISEVEGGSDFFDIIPASDVSVEDSVMTRFEGYEVHKLLDMLSSVEREVIESAFGIGGPEKQSKYIAADLGFTCDRVQQIKRRALSKLRILSQALELGQVS